MGDRTFTVRVVHGETDLAAVVEAQRANHLRAWPNWRTDAEWAAIDQQYLDALKAEEAKGQVITDEQRAFRPSTSPARAAAGPPMPQAPTCDVIIDLDDGRGGRLTLDVTDWDEAAALAKARQITVSW